MTVLDRPAGAHPTLALDRPRASRPTYTRLAYVIAALVIATHVIDALVQHGPASPPPRAVWSALTLLLAAMGVLAFLRLTHIAAALLAIALGTAPSVEAFGISVAHTIKGAASGPDGTGLASAAAGVLLVVLAAIVILARVRAWWRLLAIPIGLGYLAYVVVPLAMAVNITHSNPGALSGRTPADAGLLFYDVVVPTRDGVQLSGWYIPSRNGAAVMTITGGGGTRDGVLDHSIVLAQHGYGVLDLDPRGHGLSQGEPMDLGWYGEFDVDAGVSFLSRQTEVDPKRIAIFGTSMGGEEGLTAAARDPRIRAVVNEGGWCRVFDDLQPVFQQDPLQAALIPYYWTFLTSARFMTAAEPPPPLAKLMPLISPRLVLMIAASEQPEMLLMAHLQQQTAGNSELWIAPNTSHTQALYTHPEAWSSRVLSFLDNALSDNPT